MDEGERRENGNAEIEMEGVSLKSMEPPYSFWIAHLQTDFM